MWRLKLSPRTQRVLVCALLFLSVLAIYRPVVRFDFVSYDDDVYVQGNPRVQNGLTGDNLRWAFTAFKASTWQPLVWISYMLDHAFYADSPGGYHLTNVLLHGANVVILFLVLVRLTSCSARSAVVAMLFGLHPIHVESVAWIAERKDVLSAFFWMLSLLIYSFYVERPGWRRYLGLLACFALGLMAKPMLVTLPFVLLLLDFWPLRRFASSPGSTLPQRIRRLVLEKTPMLALAASSSILTFFVQDKGGAVTSFDALPMVFRFCNGVVAYVTYLEKLFWPIRLAVLYPYPRSIPIAAVLLSVLALTLITAFAVVMGKRRPYWVVGWLWYLGTMMPVIGIVRFGAHAMADRFAYIPFIGLYVAIVWASTEIGRRLKRGAMTLGVLAAGVLLLLALATSYQLRFWQSSITLFRHALDVTRKNPIMHANLGEALVRLGQTREAATHCREAIRQEPGLPQPYSTMGKMMSRKNKSDSAILFYETALRMDPKYVPAHNNLGNEYVALKRPQEAIKHYRTCLQIEPDNVEAHNNLGLVLAGMGKHEEALAQYQSAIRLNPRYAEAHYNLAILLEDQNHAAGAEQHYRLAIAANPAMVQAHYNLGNLFMAEGRHREALAAFEAALAIRPEYAEAINNMAMITASQGRIPEAIRLFQRALELKPDLLPAQQNLKVLQSKPATNVLTSPPAEEAAGPESHKSE